MIDSYVCIAGDLLFLCIVPILIYFFVFAVKSHHKQTDYPKAKIQHRYAILIPETNSISEKYKDEPYEFITYKDLIQTVQTLDDERYEFVIILAESACTLSPKFIEKINKVYDAGVKAIQLHTIVTNRRGFGVRLRALFNEISNSLFKAGSTQLNLSSALSGTNMAIDLQWLKKNQRSIKTNIERKLFRQNMYVEYLADTIVYCEKTPAHSYRRRRKKELSYLMSSLVEGNWSFCNRIIQQVLPSPLALYILTCLMTLLITGFEWTSSIKWWISLYMLTVIYSLAIPDYFVKDKKKFIIWRKTH